VSNPAGFLAPSLTHFQATSVRLGDQHAPGWNCFGQGTSVKRLLIVDGVLNPHLRNEWKRGRPRI